MSNRTPVPPAGANLPTPVTKGFGASQKVHAILTCAAATPNVERMEQKTGADPSYVAGTSRVDQDRDLTPIPMTSIPPPIPSQAAAAASAASTAPIAGSYPVTLQDRTCGMPQAVSRCAISSCTNRGRVFFCDQCNLYFCRNHKTHKSHSKSEERGAPWFQAMTIREILAEKGQSVTERTLLHVTPCRDTSFLTGVRPLAYWTMLDHNVLSETVSMFQFSRVGKDAQGSLRSPHDYSTIYGLVLAENDQVPFYNSNREMDPERRGSNTEYRNISLLPPGAFRYVGIQE